MRQGEGEDEEKARARSGGEAHRNSSGKSVKLLLLGSLELEMMLSSFFRLRGSWSLDMAARR